MQIRRVYLSKAAGTSDSEGIWGVMLEPACSYIRTVNSSINHMRRSGVRFRMITLRIDRYLPYGNVPWWNVSSVDRTSLVSETSSCSQIHYCCCLDIQPFFHPATSISTILHPRQQGRGGCFFFFDTTRRIIQL